MEQQTETTSTKIVSYDNVDIGKISCTSPQQKPVPDTPGTFYYNISIFYNYGTSESQEVNSFNIEGPELVSNGGIIIKESPGKEGKPPRMEHSILVSLPTSKPAVKQFCDTINGIHAGCSYIVGQCKGTVGMPHFRPDMAEATGFTNPVYMPRDKTTSEIIQGRDPSIFLKLIKGAYKKTLFTTPDKTPIDWKYLQGVELSFIPLISIEKIYIGSSKIRLQMKLISAVVTSIVAINSETSQIATSKRLLDERPGVMETLSAQLSRLMTDRNKTDQPGKKAETPSNVPQFGVLPVSSMAATTASISVPTPARQISMAEFTSGSGTLTNIPKV